jgi:hypothetical protein
MSFELSTTYPQLLADCSKNQKTLEKQTFFGLITILNISVVRLAIGQCFKNVSRPSNPRGTFINGRFFSRKSQQFPGKAGFPA